jgi:hypothetical protein
MVWAQHWLRPLHLQQGNPMHRLILGLALALLLPQPGLADVFAQLSGLHGDPEFAPESCAENPAHSAFSPDRTRIVVSWADPVESYTGALITSFGGTVVGSSGTSITMLRDNETRFAPDGTLVLWEMRVMADPQGYCWRRLDWAQDVCLPLVRCEAEANS